MDMLHCIAMSSIAVMILSDANANANSSKKQTKHFNPRQMVNLFERLLPKLKSSWQHLLNERKSEVRSIIIENEIDSFNVGFLARDDIMNCLDVESHVAFWKLIEILQRVVKKSGASLQWEHVVNAVSHELGHNVAKSVASGISYLGDIAKYTPDQFVRELGTKMAKKLSIAEAEYMRSLFGRATASVLASSLVILLTILVLLITNFKNNHNRYQ